MSGTAAVTGRSGFLAWSTANSSGATTKIGALQNWTLTNSRPPIDATSFDSSGYSEALTGILSWDVKATLFSYSSDSQQKAARKQIAAAAPVPLFINLYPASTSKTFKYQGKCNLSDVALKAGTKDVLMYDVTLKGTGKLTFSS